MNISGVTMPRDPIQEEPTYESALAAFEKLAPVRILFDNGAGGDPGKPYPGFEQSFKSFPVEGTTARSWFLGPGGTLADAAPGKRGADAFTWNAKARPPTNFKGDTGPGDGGLWTQLPKYAWTQNPPGTAVSYLTAPLAQDTVVLGQGGVTAWVKTAAKSVDLQATITEVRPDGKETYVQSGYLRTLVRKLDPAKGTPLEPRLSLRKTDFARMPKDKFAKLTIPLYYQGHAYRKGSRLRVTVSAVVGDQPIWAFRGAAPKKGTPTVTIGYGKGTPSRVLLPVAGGVNVPTGLPPCPGLRAEPCRDYVALANRPAKR